MCVCIYASNDRYCFPDWTPKAWDKSVRKSSSRSNIYTYVYVSIHIYTYVYMYLRFQRPFMFTQTHTHTHAYTQTTLHDPNKPSWCQLSTLSIPNDELARNRSPESHQWSNVYPVRAFFERLCGRTCPLWLVFVRSWHRLRLARSTLPQHSGMKHVKDIKFTIYLKHACKNTNFALYLEPVETCRSET